MKNCDLAILFFIFLKNQEAQGVCDENKENKKQAKRVDNNHLAAFITRMVTIKFMSAVFLRTSGANSFCADSTQ